MRVDKRTYKLTALTVLVTVFLFSLLVLGMTKLVNSKEELVNETEKNIEKVEILKERVQDQDQLIRSLETLMHNQQKTIDKLREELKLLETANTINTRYRTITKDKAKEVVVLVKKYSAERELDFELVMSIIGAESSFDYRAKSSYGAVGLMQVVPRWHMDKLSGRDALDIEVNIDVGTQILREYIDIFDGDLERALAKYNGASTPSKASSYLTSIEINRSILKLGTDRIVASL